MKTTVEIPEESLAKTMAYTGAKTKKEAINMAIEEFNRIAGQRALLKLKEAGIKTSVMILNGMGGMKYSQQHAENSARLMNEAQPDFLSTLVVSYPLGDDRVREGFNGEYELPDQRTLFMEMKHLIETLELENTIFRSDHASNYVALKGTLGADKQRFLNQLDDAIAGRIALRQEWQRGL